MHVISIQGSKAQKSKLRNGHKVRIKHGAGFNVIVNPNTYHIVSRAFMKNKGISLQLSPEEISMNRAPSPEMQRAIMGQSQPMMIPGVTDHLHLGGRGLGTGIGDWFKNLGNTIKSGFEDKIINPIKENIVNPATDLYNKNVPEEIRRDINTGLKFSSPIGLTADFFKRIKNGEKIQDIGKNYFEDLKHLNNTKNKIIKSSPVLTDAYKKGVLATAGLGSAALGSAFGLSPATGALASAAGTMGANELLKAEGYGFHHAIEHGEKHHYHELKHHSKPIGGALGWNHITNFFKHAGHAIKKAVPVVRQGAQMAHNFLLNNPKLAAKVKEHGSKLAGMLAKKGMNYMMGNEKYGDQAEQMGTKLADEQIHQNLGYGIHHAIEEGEKHHYHQLKHHRKPIGGALRWNHITSFFKNAGNAIQKAMPVVKQGAQMAHNFLLNNPKLAAKVKEHGSKLAGMLAKAGINYITGNEKYGDQAEQMGSKLADEQIHQNLGYGLYAGRQVSGRGAKMSEFGKQAYANASANAAANIANARNTTNPNVPTGNKWGEARDRESAAKTGYIMGGTVRHYGSYAEPQSRLVGGGFNSFDTLHQATIDNAKANHMLGTLQNMIVQNQHLADPIKKYWDDINAPPSRGSGLHKNHHGKVHHMRKAGYEKHNPYNLVRGKGTLMEHKSELPPALQSQPYGVNFHMQNMLPPQYQKYNDGTNEY